jgi:hypothetical protein
MRWAHSASIPSSNLIHTWMRRSTRREWRDRCSSSRVYRPHSFLQDCSCASNRAKLFFRPAEFLSWSICPSSWPIWYGSSVGTSAATNFLHSRFQIAALPVTICILCITHLFTIRSSRFAMSTGWKSLIWDHMEAWDFTRISNCWFEPKSTATTQRTQAEVKWQDGKEKKTERGKISTK